MSSNQDGRQKYEVKLLIAHYKDIALKVRSQIVQIEVGQISNYKQISYKDGYQIIVFQASLFQLAI